MKIKNHHLNYNDTSQNKINAVFSLKGLGTGVFHFPLGKEEGGGKTHQFTVIHSNEDLLDKYLTLHSCCAFKNEMIYNFI